MDSAVKSVHKRVGRNANDFKFVFSGWLPPSSCTVAASVSIDSPFPVPFALQPSPPAPHPAPPSNNRTLESTCGSCVHQLSGWYRAVYCAWH